MWILMADRSRYKLIINYWADIRTVRDQGPPGRHLYVVRLTPARARICTRTGRATVHWGVSVTCVLHDVWWTHRRQVTQVDPQRGVFEESERAHLALGLSGDGTNWDGVFSSRTLGVRDARVGFHTATWRVVFEISGRACLTLRLGVDIVRCLCVIARRTLGVVDARGLRNGSGEDILVKRAGDFFYWRCKSRVRCYWQTLRLWRILADTLRTWAGSSQYRLPWCTCREGIWCARRKSQYQCFCLTSNPWKIQTHMSCSRAGW